MSDAETKQIEGVCEEISEKNGWTAFAINVGSQYPIRISTKLPALIEQGRAVGQQKAVWTFKETQGGENPNKPGTYYTNRYFDSVEVGGTVAPAARPNEAVGAPLVPVGFVPVGPGPTVATHAPLPAGDKDRAITRMAVLKAAAEVSTGIEFAPGEDIAAIVIAMAARFETWVYRDTSEIPF